MFTGANVARSFCAFTVPDHCTDRSHSPLARTLRRAWRSWRGPRTAVALIAIAASCADVTAPRGPGAPPLQSFNHPGFDTSLYPGDATMAAWAHGGSPYEWAGYYLPAPCHRDVSWSGTRQRLVALGWGLTVIYVGQQTWDGVAQLQPPPGSTVVPSPSRSAPAPSPTRVAPRVDAGAPTCSRTLLSSQEGDAEAADAIAKTATEGFPDGTVIFLDLEHMDVVSSAMQDYYRAWVGRLLADGRFRPGIYVHRANATQVYGDLRDVYVSRGLSGAPEFWITGGTGFSLSSLPTDTGFPYASMWQGVYDATRLYNGASVVVDESVSRNWSPSFPDRVTNP